MDDEKFMEFIYFSLSMISVNFPDQLVTDMSKPVLKSEITRNGSLMKVNFLHKVEESFN